MPEYTLTDKVAVVIGASRGIGAAIANAYAIAGATVCSVSRTASDTAGAHGATGSKREKVTSYVADVTNPNQIAETIDRIAQIASRIDILVVCAGRAQKPSTVEESDISEWRNVIETNLLGAYYCIRSAIPHLRRSTSGKVITIGSGLGHKGAGGNAAYSVSKAGLWMLTRVVAVELAEYGISVNELIPGPVNTALSKGMRAASRPTSWNTEWHKEPDDVVPLAMFLATQPTSGPTAQSYSLMRRDT